MNTAVITVSQLNKYVKSVIEGDRNLQNIFVSGEISNCRVNSTSGHCYFSLKDGFSLVKCAMFKSDASRLKFSLQNGMKVLCRGRVSLYERDGAFQFYAADIQPDGLGSLALQFEQTKARLQAEGLFDISTKKPLPEYPQKIAVLTADSGAAIHDIVNILGRRFPLCEVLVVPVTVQGTNAALNIINKLEQLYKLKNIDIIILGRGGGSAEDLSTFNDEQLARTLKKSPVPTVSAVGHESDYSITDLVADIRASTPSAAAELCVPEKSEVLQYLDSLTELITLRTKYIIDRNKFKITQITNSKVFKTKISFINNLSEKFNKANLKLNLNFINNINKNSELLKHYAGILAGLNPLEVLARGYTVASKNGKQVKNVTELQKNDTVALRFANGTANCTVNSTEEQK